MKTTAGLAAGSLLFVSLTVQADQVIPDDLIVQGSVCVGAECQNNESFGFDTVRLKGENPIIRFLDTSVGSFPGNDWSLGIADHAEGEPTRFFIFDDSGNIPVLVLEGGATGGVALGAGSALEPGAVSVGAAGSERRVANVADAVEDTDAVNLGQFNAFKTEVNDNFATELATERAELDEDIAALQDSLQALTNRLDTLVSQLGLD